MSSATVGGPATHLDLFGQALELPPAWTPPPRPAVPLLASVVPILGAVALWLVTGSILSLWLAALGPLIAGATFVDSARSARRARRRADAAAAVARSEVARAIGERHDSERAGRWARHPDVAAYVARDTEVWRPVSGRSDSVVVGAGPQASALVVSGGGDERHTAELRARAATLTDAPMLLPPTAGIAVVAGPVLGPAIVRALALQLCLALPPGDLRLLGPLGGDHSWADRLPHRRAGHGRSLGLIGAGEAVPPGADIPIVHIAPGSPTPPRCSAVITARSPSRATVDYDGDLREISVEALGFSQAAAIADDLAERARRSLGSHQTREPVALASLLEALPTGAPGSLPAVIGMEAGEVRTLDLVGDGPHAVVAGVTGAGKSELLVTWILSLCAAHSTGELSFLLADFKGGTAFDALAALPHVTGVLTDLEGAGARRAIESLRAEVRWREAELARRGARDILSAGGDLPRLVIVVDEFAALLGDHPELHAVFTDVAARGRALGMHLVLGTQRPSGVMRESLLANCPLRISLRVSDTADSRAVIGSAEAAELPGGPEGRGIALVRTASDASPRQVRIALSSPDDVVRIATRTAGPAPRRPWLPALPVSIDLQAAMRAHPLPPGDDVLVLGLADEPEQQRQLLTGIGVGDRGLLVVGSAGSGRSTALRTLASQVSGGVVVIPQEGEGAWDAAIALTESPAARGTVIVIDDLDSVGADLPPDYARELLERLERIIRRAGDAGVLVIASARRLGAGSARLGELLPRRLVLGAASRPEYIALGGDATHYAPGEPAGRGRIDGRAVQVAHVPAGSPGRRHRAVPLEPWHPIGVLTGFVLRRSPATRHALAEWERRGARVLTLEEFAAEVDWASDGPVVVAAEPEDWQRHWRVLTAVRAEYDLVIDATCAPDLRVLTGERALPPYCEPGRARAWLVAAGAPPVRVALPTPVDVVRAPA